MSSAAVSERLLTAEEFAKLPNPPDGSRQELVRGRVITMPPPGFAHGDMQLKVAILLKEFAKANRLGRVVVESGVKTEKGPDTVRGPDVSYWSFDRLPEDVTPDGYPEVVADLCAEVRSPDQSMQKLREKVREYLKSGVRMVWIVDPRDETVTSYRTPGRGTIYVGEECVCGEDVVPGFQVPATKFFHD